MSSFAVTNTSYNTKKLDGLPNNTLKALGLGGTGGYHFAGTGAAFAMSNLMQQNQTIKGYEQGYLGQIQGPQ